MLINALTKDAQTKELQISTTVLMNVPNQMDLHTETNQLIYANDKIELRSY
jgi:hypothetical protein